MTQDSFGPSGRAPDEKDSRMRSAQSHAAPSADCRVTIAPRGMSFDATGRLQKGEHGTRTPPIQGAPLESYSPEDRAFYRFWYGHMQDDLMQPPLANISHATARYIWDAAKEQK